MSSLIIFASVTAANCALNDAHCTSSTVSVVCLQLSRCHARKNTTCLGNWIFSIISGDSERKCTHVVELVRLASLTILMASPRKRTSPRLLVMANGTPGLYFSFTIVFPLSQPPVSDLWRQTVTSRNCRDDTFCAGFRDVRRNYDKQAENPDVTNYITAQKYCQLFNGACDGYSQCCRRAKYICSKVVTVLGQIPHCDTTTLHNKASETT